MTKTSTMCRIVRGSLLFIALIGCTRAGAVSGAGAVSVTRLKTPNGGIQPQARMDPQGVLHLIYFKGKPQSGDIFYVRQTPGATEFSQPIRVNSQAGSAIAMGTIRGAQLAIGRGNRVCVAWNGSNSAAPKGVGGTPMLYTRLSDNGSAFEPQRNLITWAGGLDGGGAIAADDKGHVFVTWHAAPTGQEDAERSVYLARSTDDGATFEREKKINTQPTGACGCCQMRAFVDARGSLYVVYRAAGQNVNRDSTLLVSRDNGATFQSVLLQPWSIAACPMSSYALAEHAGTLRAAWETKEQIYTASLEPAPVKPASIQPATPPAATPSIKVSLPLGVPGQGDNRKHPTLAFNGAGEMLLAWTEGTGWNKGGSLAWQVYDQNGRPTEDKGRIPGVPTWGLASAFATPGGSFTLIY